MASVRIIEATSRVSGKITGYKVRWREGGRGTREKAGPVFKVKAEASAFAERKRTELVANHSLTATRKGLDLPMAEVIARYINSRVARGRILAEHAFSRTAEITKFCAARDWKLTADITASSVNEWQTENGGRGARLGAYLRAILRWAADTLSQTVDPVAIRELLPPKTKRRAKAKRPTAIQLAAWQAAADKCGENAGTFVYCLETFGWRPIMAAKLTVGDVDLARGWVTLGRMKNGDDLAHPLGDEATARIARITSGRFANEPLFLDPRSGRGWLATTTVDGKDTAPKRTAPSDWWRTHIDAAAGHGIYQLKREAISRMLANRMDLEDVRKFTGHRTIAQVLVYCTTNEESQLQSLKMIR